MAKKKARKASKSKKSRKAKKTGRKTASKRKTARRGKSRKARPAAKRKKTVKKAAPRGSSAATSTPILTPPPAPASTGLPSWNTPAPAERPKPEYPSAGGSSQENSGSGGV